MTAATIYTVDIETRPTEAFVWGLWNENIPVQRIIEPGGVLMFAAKKYGEKNIEAHCEWDGREAMVAAAHGIYDAADYVVTYNGKSFDSKHLRAEWARQGLAPPSPWRDIDLYTTVRKNFRVPSKKLSFITSYLDMEGKLDDGGFETWTQILRPDSRKQQKAAQELMVEYCKNDVKITEQLFDRLKPWVDGLNLPLYGTVDDFSRQCSRCGSDRVQSRGWAYTTAYRYRRYQCRECMGWMREKSSEPTLNAELRSV